MIVYQIVEYDRISKYGFVTNGDFLRYTNLLFTKEEDAEREAKEMNFVYIFEKFRVEETLIK